MLTRNLVSMLALLGAAVGCDAAPAPAPPPTPPTRPAFPIPLRTGDVHDFDFLVGAWTVENRTLKGGPDDPPEWATFTATSCMTPYLAGVVNVDEYRFPSTRTVGLTFRAFDLAKRRWSIYWIEGRVGVLLPPVTGGFTGDRGEFFGPDELDGKPVVYRFVWNRLGTDHARWEQAFSSDGAKWTVNWVMDFTRTGSGCRA